MLSCPELAAAAEHVAFFAVMMRDPTGHELPAWIQADTDLPDLAGFLRRLLQGLDGETNGLTMPLNSGICEGNVNWLKTFKRQMPGRAKLDLLRFRVQIRT